MWHKEIADCPDDGFVKAIQPLIPFCLCTSNIAPVQKQNWLSSGKLTLLFLGFTTPFKLHGVRWFDDRSGDFREVLQAG